MSSVVDVFGYPTKTATVASALTQGTSSKLKYNNPNFDNFEYDIIGDAAGVIIGTIIFPPAGIFVNTVVDTYGKNIKDNNGEYNNQQSISKEKEKSTIEALERIKREEEKKKKEQEERKERAKWHNH